LLLLLLLLLLLCYTKGSSLSQQLETRLAKMGAPALRNGTVAVSHAAHVRYYFVKVTKGGAAAS